eukprot:scaffold12817_cov75-Phaeocystis_antarctica.AAC.7
MRLPGFFASRCLATSTPLIVPLSGEASPASCANARTHANACRVCFACSAAHSASRTCDSKASMTSSRHSRSTARSSCFGRTSSCWRNACTPRRLRSKISVSKWVATPNTDLPVPFVEHVSLSRLRCLCGTYSSTLWELPDLGMPQHSMADIL